MTIKCDRFCRLIVGKEFLERAEGIEPSSSVWKTEVLTITQRPRPSRRLFQLRYEVKKYVSSHLPVRARAATLGSEHLAVDLHEHPTQMPLPMCPRQHSVNPSAADLSGKHRAKSVRPKSNRFAADRDVAFVQHILHITMRKRETNVHHHG
jgi:hypothetical protein